MAGSDVEFWLRGPVSGVPAMLQPVAHALLQASEEITALLEDFDENLLWERPAGVASVGFHLQHIPGAIDRLFTYARGESLSARQREALLSEGKPPREQTSVEALLGALRDRVETALDQLRATDPRTLNDHRAVGRAQLPSTVLGLLFHAAEHTQRHLGQVIVTARVQRRAAG